MIAAEALDQGPGASHRPQEDGTRPGEANRRGDGKKTEKKQEGLTPQEEEDAAKKTPLMPDFKPAESAEFQLGDDNTRNDSSSFPRITPPTNRSHGLSTTPWCPTQWGSLVVVVHVGSRKGAKTQRGKGGGGSRKGLAIFAS